MEPLVGISIRSPTGNKWHIPEGWVQGLPMWYRQLWGNHEEGWPAQLVTAGITTLRPKRKLNPVGASVERVILRGSVTFGGDHEAGPRQLCSRKQGTVGPDLTGLFPPTSCRGSPLDKPSWKPEGKWACESNLHRSASEAESSGQKGAERLGQEGGNGRYPARHT